MKPKTKTRKQMRLAIGRDVLQQIAAKRITPLSGTYYSGPSLANKDAQNALLDALECRVCALGAAFVSRVRLFNSFSTDSREVGRGEMQVSLAEFFPLEELIAIEAAFEGWGYYISDAFQRLEDETRMIFIWKYIVYTLRGRRFRVRQFQKAAEKFAKSHRG
jgi:hypothetical protein